MESLINSDFFLGENMKINNQEINIDDLLEYYRSRNEER